MKLKKILGLIIIIIFIIIAGYYLVLKLAFNDGFLGGTISKDKETIRSNLGDEFLITYKVKDFPENATYVYIKDSKESKIIASFIVCDNTYKVGDFVTIINQADIRCYKVENHLIYKIDNGKFKGISIGAISTLIPDDYNDFIEVARSLVATNQWEWIKACGGFLLVAGDKDIKVTLERYVLGNFTQSELEINKSSSIRKEDMVEFAEFTLQNSQ